MTNIENTEQQCSVDMTIEKAETNSEITNDTAIELSGVDNSDAISSDVSDDSVIDFRTNIDFGDDVDSEDIDTFISLSEQLGFTLGQAKSAWQTLQQAHVEQNQADAALATVYEKQLRHSWGQGYDDNMASAQQGILSSGGDELRDVLENAGIAGHPVVMQAFSRVGKTHLEQGTASSDGGRINNPFHHDTYNLTEQMRLYRENPSLATMLEKAATS